VDNKFVVDFLPHANRRTKALFFSSSKNEKTENEKTEKKKSRKKVTSGPKKFTPSRGTVAERGTQPPQPPRPHNEESATCAPRHSLTRAAAALTSLPRASRSHQHLFSFSKTKTDCCRVSRSHSPAHGVNAAPVQQKRLYKRRGIMSSPRVCDRCRKTPSAAGFARLSHCSKCMSRVGLSPKTKHQANRLLVIFVASNHNSPGADWVCFSILTTSSRPSSEARNNGVRPVSSA
jgi:hypothetical protein